MKLQLGLMCPFSRTDRNILKTTFSDVVLCKGPIHVLWSYPCAKEIFTISVKFFVASSPANSAECRAAQYLTEKVLKLGRLAELAGLYQIA